MPWPMAMSWLPVMATPIRLAVDVSPDLGSHSSDDAVFEDAMLRQRAAIVVRSDGTALGTKF